MLQYRGNQFKGNSIHCLPLIEFIADQKTTRPSQAPHSNHSASSTHARRILADNLAALCCDFGRPLQRKEGFASFPLNQLTRWRAKKSRPSCCRTSPRSKLRTSVRVGVIRSGALAPIRFYFTIHHRQHLRHQLRRQVSVYRRPGRGQDHVLHRLCARLHRRCLYLSVRGSVVSRVASF